MDLVLTKVDYRNRDPTMQFSSPATAEQWNYVIS